MDRSTALETLHTETGKVIELGRTSDPHSPVEACPSWDMAKLLRHLCDIYNWVGTIVLERLDAPPPRERLPQRPEGAPIGDWLDSRAQRLVAALAEAPEDALVWNFGTGEPAPPDFWWRRQVHETLIHRVDAEVAAGAEVTGVDPVIASDNVTELLELLRFARLAAPPPDGEGETPEEGHPFTVHLHASDVPQGARCGKSDAYSEWTMDAATRTVSASHTKGDAAFRGPAWGLATWLWGRGGHVELESFGDAAAAEEWRRSIGV